MDSDIDTVQLLFPPRIGQRRIQYPKESNLAVVAYWREHKSNISEYAISKAFKISEKMLNKWIKKEEVILNMRTSQRKDTRGREGEYPMMEQHLSSQFHHLREQGVRITRTWFLAEARRYTPDLISSNIPMHTLMPAFTICNSDGQFLGRFSFSNIGNMDQIPLEFEFLSGATYASKGSTVVWIHGQGSGLDKRQATLQVTVFSETVNCVKPLLIFKGIGTQIIKREKYLWDPRVVVDFQENAWADEKQCSVDLESPNHCTESILHNTVPRMLVLDVHMAQKTPHILDVIRRLNTLPVLIPSGCTSELEFTTPLRGQDLIDEETSNKNQDPEEDLDSTDESFTEFNDTDFGSEGERTDFGSEGERTDSGSEGKGTNTSSKSERTDAGSETEGTDTGSKEESTDGCSESGVSTDEHSYTRVSTVSGLRILNALNKVVRRGLKAFTFKVKVRKRLIHSVYTARKRIILQSSFSNSWIARNNMNLATTSPKRHYMWWVAWPGRPSTRWDIDHGVHFAAPIAHLGN
ncbi:hypothetical protein DFH27DRAFT_528641 [Peziza echinospora]|nr:hypothetical protein DFH27DRAFT_528641 [Peziza echinospora]